MVFLFAFGGLTYLGLSSSDSSATSTPASPTAASKAGSSGGSTTSTCADAIKCCKMLSHNVPAAAAACDNLKKLPAVGDGCQRALDSYQKALKAQGKTCP